MGNDITQYRAAIGSFYSRTHRSLSIFRSHFSIHLNIICFILLLYLLLLRCFVNNDDFMLYRIVLLLLCMDVHVNPGPTEHNDALTIFHLNTRSIRNKLESILDVCDEYDILCFTETHLNDNVPTSDLKINGFNKMFRKDRSCHGGGILVYTADHIVTTRRIDLESPTVETLWLEVTLQCSPLLICGAYRSEISPTLFFEHLSRSLESAIEFSPLLTITGDININFLNSLPLFVKTV